MSPDERSEHGDRTPLAVKILLGGVAAAAIATLIFLTRPDSNGTSVAVSSMPPTTTQTQSVQSSAPTRPPLTDFVPGLDGQLVTLQGQGPMLLITRNADSPEVAITVMPGGWASNVSFDASGDLLGLTSSTDGPDHLHLGNETELTDTRFLVTSYVWHATRPAEVAMVTINADSWNLNTFRFDPLRRQITDQTNITGFGAPRSIRAWYESGFVLTGYDETSDTPLLEVIDPTGEVVWQEHSELLGASVAGDILAGQFTDDAWELRIVNVEDPAGGPSEVLSWAPPNFNAVRWSTDGQMIAFTGYRGPGSTDWELNVYTPNGSLLHSQVVPWRIWDTQWSPDDRYILMPGSDNQGTHAVIFYNRQTDSLSAVDDFQDWVQWSDLRE